MFRLLSRFLSWILLLACLVQQAQASAWTSRSCPRFFADLGSNITSEKRLFPIVAFSEGIQKDIDSALAFTREYASSYYLDSKFPPFRKEEIEIMRRLQKARSDRVAELNSIRTERRAIRNRLRLKKGELSELEFKRLSKRKESLEKESLRVASELERLLEALVPHREWVGLSIVAEGALQAAKEQNALILLRRLQPAGVGKLMNKAVAKGMKNKFHSTDNGVIAGLVPRDQRLSRKVAMKGEEEVVKMQALVEEAIRHGEVRAKQFRIGGLVAVERNGTVEFLNIHHDAVSESEIVEVLTVRGNDGEWYPIASDIDPLAFGFKGKEEGEILESKRWGVMTTDERVVTHRLNGAIKNLLNKNKNGGRFVTHGPANRNPGCVEVSGYPISAFFPDGSIKNIPQGPDSEPNLHLKAFFKEAEAQGFPLTWHPCWK